jgi:hypothetical protein
MSCIWTVFLQVHDSVSPQVHLLLGQLQLSTSMVQPMLSLAQAVVQGLQLLILLTDHERPLAEDAILTTQPLQLQRRPDGLLLIRICCSITVWPVLCQRLNKY